MKRLIAILFAGCLTAQGQYLLDPYAATTNEVFDGLNNAKAITPATAKFIQGLGGGSGGNASVATNAPNGTPLNNLANAVTNNQPVVNFGSVTSEVYSIQGRYGPGRLANEYGLYNPIVGNTLADAGGVYAPMGQTIMDNNGVYGSGDGGAITNVKAQSLVSGAIVTNGTFTNAAYFQDNLGDFMSSGLIQDAAGDIMEGGSVADMAGDYMNGGDIQDVAGDSMNGGIIKDAAGDSLNNGMLKVAHIVSGVLATNLVLVGTAQLNGINLSTNSYTDAQAAAAALAAVNTNTVFRTNMNLSAAQLTGTISAGQLPSGVVTNFAPAITFTNLTISTNSTSATQAALIVDGSQINNGNLNIISGNQLNIDKYLAFKNGLAIIRMPLIGYGDYPSAFQFVPGSGTLFDILCGAYVGGLNSYGTNTAMIRFISPLSGYPTVLFSAANNGNIENVIVSGVMTSTNGFVSYTPHTPAAVTVGTSPFSYTNNTTTAQECYFSGGTAYSVTKIGSAVYGSIIGNDYFVLQPTNYCTITYTVAPTLFTNAW